MLKFCSPLSLKMVNAALNPQRFADPCSTPLIQAVMPNNSDELVIQMTKTSKVKKKLVLEDFYTLSTIVLPSSHIGFVKNVELVKPV